MERHPLDLTAEELSKLQEEDPTLEGVRRVADGENSTAEGTGFFSRDKLVYRRWVPQDRPSETIEQLVLPSACRKEVMLLAYKIPLSGHLGKRKTAAHLLQQFYWPTIHRHVAEYCRCCSECQKSPTRRAGKAPLIPLPIISETFSRVAMDLIGPLPKSHSGHQYILVLCEVCHSISGSRASSEH